MKMYNKIYRLSGLQLFERKLKYLYNRNLYFKRLYESNNEDTENKKYIVITGGDDKNIFSGIPNDVIEYLKLTGSFDMEIFDSKTNSISVKTYWDVLDTIRVLINIMEFDLLERYVNGELFLVENKNINRQPNLN